MGKREKEIRIAVSAEEYRIISEHAEKLHTQVAPYVRMIAMNPVVRPVDFSALMKHTREIGEIRTCINRLIYTIDAANNYLPQEIEEIVNLMNALFRSENKLLETIQGNI